jgi:hypothetical protein
MDSHMPSDEELTATLVEVLEGYPDHAEAQCVAENLRAGAKVNFRSIAAQIDVPLPELIAAFQREIHDRFGVLIVPGASGAN